MSSLNDRRPLVAYLRVQEDFDRQLLYILKRAAAEADAEIKRLAGKTNLSSRIQRDRMLLIRKNLLEQQAKMWRQVGSTIEASRLEAAAASIESNFAYERMLLRTILSEDQIAGLLASSVASAQRTVEVVTVRVNGLSDRPLSSRVYKAEAWSNDKLVRTINDALARGKTARELASAVKMLIDPATPGGVSYAAQRLGRTELNNAFHAVAVTDAVNNQIIEYVQWHLSSSHKKPDQCNDYAESESVPNQPAGVWLPTEVPAKPHPQCFCYVTPIVPDLETFTRNFVSGRYDRFLET